MPRKSRIDTPGLVHHVICRGIENQTIFRNSDDCYDFLDRVARLAGKDQIQIYAFALMPNHLHLLLRTLLMPLSTFMRRLLTGYSIYFNKRYERRGHVFQNRYKSIVIDEQSYLLELIRYIHLNPIRAGVLSSLDELADWSFSGHSSLMGKISYKWFDSEETLSHFSSTQSMARENLIHFMTDGLAMGDRKLAGFDPSIYPSIRSLNGGIPEGQDNRILGNNEFVDKVLAGIGELGAHPDYEMNLDSLVEIVSTHFHLSVAELCSSSKRRIVVKGRAVVIWLATKELSMSATEIAETLCITPTLVYRNLLAHRGKQDSESIRETFLTIRT